MREQRADTTRAVVLALLLHVALFVLMFAGLWWTRAPTPLSVAGSPVSAELIDVDALSPAMQRTLQQEPEPAPVPPEPEPVPEPEPEPVPEPAAPEPQPIPAPLPEDAPIERQPTPQVQVPEPSPVDQDEVRREAIARETAEREQEARRRQEQIDLTERKRQEEAEQKRRLAEQKLAELRRQREQAEREAREAQRRLERIAESRAEQPEPAPSAGTPPPGNQGADTGLAAQYALAIQEAILRNWTRPENVPLGQRCRITITQVRGGTVVRVDVSPSCPYDDLGRRSVEAAVLKAQPLPYAGFESVFSRTLNLNFEAQDR